MDRQKLVNILEIVNRAVERNNLIPMYEYFCFDGETVFAWNDSFGIEALCKVGTPFAVHGPTFIGLLRATKEDKIDLQVKNDQLEIRAGKSEYVLPAKGPDDFVWKDRPVFKRGNTLDVDLTTGITNCLLTSSENLALEVYSRIYIGSFEGKLTVYSIDGDAITKYVTTIPGSSDVWLARSFCEAAIKTGGGRFIIDTEWVCSVFEDFKVYGRNLGGSSFDYESHIHQILDGQEPNTIPFPLKLDDSLTRARVVADIETSPTRIIIENGEMVLMTETPFGEVYDVMTAKKHRNTEAEINSALLQKNMAGCNEFQVLNKCCVLKGAQVFRLTSNL